MVTDNRLLGIGVVISDGESLALPPLLGDDTLTSFISVGET